MKWKIEILQVVDAPDNYTADQVRNAVKEQFGTEVVRVEKVEDAEMDTTTNDNTTNDDTTTDNNDTTTTS